MTYKMQPFLLYPRKSKRKQICRFGYSKEKSNHTFLRDDGHNQPELVTARNDTLINSHNWLQLQGWWANVDLKPILSPCNIFQNMQANQNRNQKYLTKYLVRVRKTKHSSSQFRNSFSIAFLSVTYQLRRQHTFFLASSIPFKLAIYFTKP